MVMCSRALWTLVWGDGSSSNRTATLRTVTITKESRPSQSLDLNPIERLWKDLKMSLPQPFLSNLSSKGSTKKNGRNCLKNGCAKLVLSYSDRRGCELALYNFNWIEWSFSVIMRCKLFKISSYSKMKYLNLWLNFFILPLLFPGATC